MARVGQRVVAGDRLPDRIGVGVLMAVFPPALVDDVVQAPGVREQRRRTLPARLVVYYVLMMVLFFQSSYVEVWTKLVAGLDWATRFRWRLVVGMQPSAAAITKARGRVGWEVMAGLFERVAGSQAGEGDDFTFCRGMRLVAVDGVCLDLPNTPDNAAEFGYPGNEKRRGPFPQIRVVAAGECGTRAVLGAVTGGLDTGEQALGRQMLGRLRAGDLLLADRNFCSHALLAEVAAQGVHVLWRVKADVDLPVGQVLPEGTYLSRILDPVAARRRRRRKTQTNPRDIPGIPARVIEYSVTSEDDTEVSETFCLITDLLDPTQLPAAAAAAAYAQRWQLETCFDERETSIRGGATVVLRSRSPHMIRQEIYAMLCLYQAIRTLICHAAHTAGLDPDQISFTRTRHGVQARVSDSTGFSPC